MSSHYISSHYGGSHYLSSHYGRVVVPPVPEEPGTGWQRRPWERERPDFYREQILKEDEELLELLTIFLHIMDD